MVLDYSLTYAGVPFVSDVARVVRMSSKAPEQEVANQLPPEKHQPLADLVDELNRIIPFQYLNDFSLPTDYPGRNLGAIASKQRIGPQPMPNVRIGDWYYPNTASRWSVFRGLATSSQVAAMLAAATSGSEAGQQTFVMLANPISPDNEESLASDYTLQTQMFLLPPRPLAEHGGGRTKGESKSYDGLYLITLVDERYWWQFQPSTLQPITNQTNWGELLDTLAGNLGISLTYDPISSVYQTPEPDSQFWTNSENAAQLLDAVAANIGRTVVRNLDGSFVLMTALDSQDTVFLNRGLAEDVVRTAGGDIFNSGFQNLVAGDLTPAKNLVVPANVEVSFPLYVFGNDPVPHFANTRYQSPRPSCWYEESYGATYSVIVPLTSGGSLVNQLTGQGRTHAIHDTAKALISGEVAIQTGIPLNNQGLTDLSIQLATDYWNNQVAEALDETYPGTLAWTPEGFHDIIWTYSARSRQACTRVMKTQWNAMIKEMQHSTPDPVVQTFSTAGLSSGQPLTYVTAGVGGPSVAQTIRDSYPVDIYGILSSPMGSGDLTATFSQIDCLPTQNRWKASIDDETVLFEGTSGLTTVNVVYRGIDGTSPASHPTSTQVFQDTPDTNYGINLTSYEKMQFTYPGAWTSGGIQEVHIVPQTQSVRILSSDSATIHNVPHFSGRVYSYDTTAQGTGQYIAQELCWVIERNQGPISSGTYHGGQFLGYSASGKVSPVYGVDAIAGGGTGPPGPPGPALTVEYSDLSLVLPNINTLQLDPVCTWDLSQPGPGVARINRLLSVQTGFASFTPVLATTTLAALFGTSDTTATLNSVLGFPTDNPWKAEIGNEVILFAGVGGGAGGGGGGSSHLVNVIARSIDGTAAAIHNINDKVLLLGTIINAIAVSPVNKLTFVPGNTWEIAQGSSCEVLITRLFVVTGYPGTTVTDTWNINFDPTNFLVTSPAAGVANVYLRNISAGSNLTVEYSDGSVIVPNVTTLQLDPVCSWNLQTPGPGIAKINRLLTFQRQGGVAITPVATVTFAPNNTWSVTQGSNCEAVITRLFVVTANTGGGPVNDVWKIVFAPDCAWDVATDNAGTATVKRKLTIQDDQGNPPATNVSKIVFQKYNCWSLTTEGADCLIDVQRVLIVSGQVSVQDVYQINFDTTDFIVSNGGGVGGGIANIKTNGDTVDVNYCGDDGTTHQMHFQDGLLKYVI